MVQTVTSFISLEKTIGDTATSFSLENIPFYEANIHIYDNDVYYGDGSNLTAIAPANSVLTFPKGDLRDIFFKNRTAGNNGRVIVVATTPDVTVREALKGY